MKALLSSLRDDFSRASSTTGIDPLLTSARVLLYVGLAGVIVAQIMSVIGIVVHIVTQGSALLAPPYDSAWSPIGRLLLGLAALVMVQKIIELLLAMIRSVGHREAFAADNVARVERIASQVLGLQILGTLAWMIRLPIGEDIAGLDLGFRVSPAGIAVMLLLFILARVFREGTTMREDLEGTV